MNISLICACKNRYNALRISLASWLCFDEIKEIIIVDWNSNESINHLTKLDSRIKIITVQNQHYFNQPQPLNLAASIATGDYILKVDTDYIINPYYNFFEKYRVDENSFVSGHHNCKSLEFVDPTTGIVMINKFEMTDQQLGEYFYAYSPVFRYLTGFLLVSKNNFEKINGYNELFDKYYAYEDDDICNRLKLLGLNQIKINLDYQLIHLPHPDTKRIENFKRYQESGQKEIIESLEDNETKWQMEYYYSQSHISENKKLSEEVSNYYVLERTKWNLQRIDEQNYYAEKIIDDKLSGLPTVYYVSLEESQDRRDNLERQFESYGIPTKSIISKRFSESNDIVTGKYISQLNEGTTGCVVSHLKAIKDWYETTSDDYGFFCEDDLSLDTVSHWNFTWEQFIETLPEDAECVQLLSIRDNFDTFQIRERYWNDWGASAYIVTRDYAKKLIETFIIDNTYHLEVGEIQPLIENILFASVGKTYTIPLFVEEIKFQSTFVGNDDDVENGQKKNHYKAHDLVLNWWKNGNHKLTVQKTELEELLYKYSIDTENPEHNFNLGIWYENQGHTAPALSYFLRCAERSEDNDLAYEALIRGSYCYFKQGTRDGSGRGMLFQAQIFLPNRPEAYYLLARYSSKNEWWQDCYSITQHALMICDFNLPSLRTDVEYPGKYGILYEKSVSAWWWGKEKESRSLLQEIRNNHCDEIKNETYFNTIQNTLIKLATGYISEDEIKYNKHGGKKLKFNFEGSDKIEKNYSQSFQDLFVLSVLNGKRNGLYLEIGSQEPFYQNNTALLETEFEWNGISVEIKENLCKMFSEQRKNKIICADATQIDYLTVLNEFDKGTTCDYLQLDCEPSEITYQILLKIPFDLYKFAIITYEHDHYVDLTNSYRTKSRDYLKSKGYKILVPNVSLNECSPFEDWWYHPDLIDSSIVENMKIDGNVIDIKYYMIEYDI